MFQVASLQNYQQGHIGIWQKSQMDLNLEPRYRESYVLTTSGITTFRFNFTTEKN